MTTIFPCVLVVLGQACPRIVIQQMSCVCLPCVLVVLGQACPRTVI